MKRLTRQRRSDLRKRLRPWVLWAGGILGAAIFFVTLILLERGARLDVPDLPEGDAGRFVFYSALKKSGPESTAKMMPAEQVRDTDSAAVAATEKEETPAIKPENPPDSKPKAKTDGGSAPSKAGVFSIQVAATKDRKAAEAMVGRLKRKGYAAFFVHEVVRDKGAWFRVRVGPFADRGEALREIERLSEKERLNGFLIVDRK